MRHLICALAAISISSGCMPEPDAGPHTKFDNAQDESATAVSSKDAGTLAYERGDFETARIEWSSASEQGDAYATGRLALLYRDGEGVPEDAQRANELLHRAAEGGDAASQYHLGLDLLIGLSVEANRDMALAWLRKSADQGHGEAQVSLAYQLLTSDAGSYEPKEVLEWAEQGADRKDPLAYAILGIVYFEGIGVTQDISAAQQWHQRAANGGVGESSYWVATQLFVGELYSRDLGTARHYATLAVDAGHPDGDALVARIEDDLYLGVDDLDTMEDVWHDNELRFQREYIGRTFKATMPFFDVGEAFLKDGVYSVEFGDNVMFGDIKCLVSNRSQLSAISNWSKGQPITVTGVVADNEGFSFRLDRCSFKS